MIKRKKGFLRDSNSVNRRKTNANTKRVDQHVIVSFGPRLKITWMKCKIRCKITRANYGNTSGKEEKGHEYLGQCFIMTNL